MLSGPELIWTRDQTCLQLLCCRPAQEDPVKAFWERHLNTSQTQTPLSAFASWQKHKRKQENAWHCEAQRQKQACLQELVPHTEVIYEENISEGDKAEKVLRHINE